MLLLILPEGEKKRAQDIHQGPSNGKFDSKKPHDLLESPSAGRFGIEGRAALPS